MAALSLLELGHLCIRRVVKPGDLAIDATAGNGHDTLLLAELVGDNGRVVAFEPQATGRKRTIARLAGKGWNQRVELIGDGHENLARYVDRQAGAAVFNLGFLPGSDRQVVTGTETTLAALNAALEIIQPGGLVSVHCYSGHGGGRQEAEAVLAWAQKLPPIQWRVYCYQTFNKPGNPESLLLIYYIT